MILMDEKKLIRELKNKKVHALDTAIEHYTGYVSVIVYRTIGASATKQDMEEVISDTFVALWKNANNLDESRESIKSYIGAIAKNMAINKVRSMKYNSGEYSSEIDFSNNFSDKTPEEEFIDKENYEALQDMISKMGEPDSEIFFRYFFREEKLSEISQSMDLKLPTVKSRFNRGKKKLKKIFTEMGYSYEK